MQKCDFNCPVLGEETYIDNYDITTFSNYARFKDAQDAEDGIKGSLNYWYFSTYDSETVEWRSFKTDKEIIEKFEIDEKLCALSAPFIGVSQWKINSRNPK